MRLSSVRSKVRSNDVDGHRRDQAATAVPELADLLHSNVEEGHVLALVKLSSGRHKPPCPPVLPNLDTDAPPPAPPERSVRQSVSGTSILGLTMAISALAVIYEFPSPLSRAGAKQYHGQPRVRKASC